MIGNDIVDLELAQKKSNWRRRGFLEKVFSRKEQIMIAESSEPDILVWRLWSMKESAYKAQLRIQKSIKINPKSFDCQILSKKKGVVISGKNIYHTISEMNNDFVYTQARTTESDLGIFSRVIDMDQSHSQSDQLYKALISYVSTCTCHDQTDIQIVKNSLGIPELLQKGKKTHMLCSLSHHGRYGSYLTKI